jgi:AcrR family transcriptional regulator
MAAVARRAGVSKATLYNHVRDRDDLFLLLLADGCQRAATAAGAAGPVVSERLSAAATVIADDEVLVALRAHESALLVPILALGDGPVWLWVREQARELLTAAGLGADQDNVDALLRWLVSYVLTPGELLGRQRAARRISSALSGNTTLQVVSPDRSWSTDPSLTA